MNAKVATHQSGVYDNSILVLRALLIAGELDDCCQNLVPAGGGGMSILRYSWSVSTRE